MVYVCRKAEMETRRKAAEVQRLKQEEEDRRAALSLQAQLEKEAKDDAKYRQQLEQERRDHELALRLANESNGQVEDSPPVIRKYVFSIRYKLTKIRLTVMKNSYPWGRYMGNVGFTYYFDIKKKLPKTILNFVNVQILYIYCM